MENNTNLTELQKKKLEEVKRLIQEAEKTRVSDEEEKILLAEIRSGNLNAIDTLVKGSDFLILKSSVTHISKNISIDEILSTGRNIMNNILHNQTLNKNNNLYERFIVWHIQQAILRQSISNDEKINSK